MGLSGTPVSLSGTWAKVALANCSITHMLVGSKARSGSTHGVNVWVAGDLAGAELRLDEAPVVAR